MKRIPEYLLRGLLYAIGILPLWLHHFNARWLAWLVGSVFKYRRDVVTDNLSHAFPEKSGDEIRKIVRQFYLHFADIVVETIWFGASNAKRFRRSHIMEIANPEVPGRLYNEHPSVVVLYTHCGNWELLGGIEFSNYSEVSTGIHQSNSCVVYRKMHSRTWDNILMDNRKAVLKDKKNYEGLLESREILRYALRNRNEKKFYHFNTDQRPYFSAPDFIEVEFMGRKVDTMSGAAALAAKLGLPVAYLGMKQKSRGHYVLEYNVICENAAQMPVAEIMQRYYDLLQKDIEECPFNYLWSHRRWNRVSRSAE